MAPAWGNLPAVMSPRTATLTSIAALAALVAGLGVMVLRALHEQFDADEFQHLHLAWQVAGGRLLYRELFDNHGPLYTLLNAAQLQLTGAPASFELLFWCRGQSIAMSLGLLALTYAIGRRLALPRPVALAAVGVTALLVMFQDKAGECRPDPLQNLFWFGGLLLLLAPAARRTGPCLFAAGALLGLAVLTNAKAALAPFALALCYLGGPRLHGLPWPTVRRELALLSAGGLLVYLLALLWFARLGTIADWHLHQFWWNLLFVGGGEEQPVALGNIGFLVRHQWPFLLAFAGGLIAWIRDLRQPQGLLPRTGGWLLLAPALVTGSALLLDFYSQFFLIFLPLWAIIAAFGLWRGATLLAARLGPWVPAALVAAGAAVMLTAPGLLLAEQPSLTAQRALTRLILSITPRDEAVGVLWSNCGGYAFNAPLRPLWMVNAGAARTETRRTGTNPDGQALVNRLEAGPVRYLLGPDDLGLQELPAATQRYIREHYRYGNCLWTRRRDRAAAP
jgi:hypothetical protein